MVYIQDSSIAVNRREGSRTQRAGVECPDTVAAAYYKLFGIGQEFGIAVRHPDTCYKPCGNIAGVSCFKGITDFGEDLCKLRKSLVENSIFTLVIHTPQSQIMKQQPWCITCKVKF